MSTQYHIYGNDGMGGPVDYSTILATVSASPWSSAPLATSSDNRFAVRAFDTTSALEEKNVDAIVRVVVDGGGLDVSAVPNAPKGLSVLAQQGGTAKVTWMYDRAGQGAAPTSFNVYLTLVSHGSVDYTTVAATMTAVSGLNAYQVTLSGLTDGVPYFVAVRSVSGSLIEANTANVVVTGSNSTPPGVDDLAAVVS